MGFLGDLMNATASGVRAFRESMMHADPLSARAASWSAWSRWDSRLSRYDMLWSTYQNDSYAELVHTWATRYKVAYGLYKHTRHLYNPAYRLVEFWAGHLMAGLLDPLAGDGETAPSALPILTENEALRPAIAALWKASRWQVEKETFARFGAGLGDVGLRLADDPDAGQVRLEVVHPGHLKYVAYAPGCRDVTGYVIERLAPADADDWRTADVELDPEATGKVARYQERCWLDDDGVTVYFQTFKDGKPFGWGGNPPEWTKPYGFVPLRVVQHESLGVDWGACCYHSGLSRFREVDDQASGLGDQIRKAIRAPMLLAGVSGPAEIKDPVRSRAARDPRENGDDPEPERTAYKTLYTPKADAKAHHLTFDLKIDHVCGHISNLNADIEKNFPELLADTGNLQGTVTAEAIRNARSLASGKVQARRVAYDDALVYLQRGAMVIGGKGGYRGYEAFRRSEIGGEELDHQIGQRAVFEINPRDQIEDDAAFWAAANAAKTAGVPIELYLERNGWTADDLAALARAKAKAQAEMVAMAAAMPKPNPPADGGPPTMKPGG